MNPSRGSSSYVSYASLPRQLDLVAEALDASSRGLVGFTGRPLRGGGYGGGGRGRGGGLMAHEVLSWHLAPFCVLTVLCGVGEAGCGLSSLSAYSVCSASLCSMRGKTVFGLCVQC